MIPFFNLIVESLLHLSRWGGAVALCLCGVIFVGADARIIGIDMNPAAVKWRQEGFEIFIGSQSDPNFWDNLSQKWEK